MPKYDIPVWKMCEEASRELPETFTPIEVIRKIQEKRPNVKPNTIRCHVIGLSPNHPSSKHYTMGRELFYYLGNGRYRRLYKTGEKPIPSRDETILETKHFNEDMEYKEDEFSFEFEADLEGHLVNKLSDIEDGLALYVTPDGIKGCQFTIGVGRIDLLAIDRNNDFVVIELKVGQATDKACSQVLRYMGWVKKHMAGDRNVRGIIICKTATDRLKYATSLLDNVCIKEYEVTFSFNDTDLEIEDKSS